MLLGLSIQTEDRRCSKVGSTTKHYIKTLSAPDDDWALAGEWIGDEGARALLRRRSRTIPPSRSWSLEVSLNLPCHAMTIRRCCSLGSLGPCTRPGARLPGVTGAPSHGRLTFTDAAVRVCRGPSQGATSGTRGPGRYCGGAQEQFHPQGAVPSG